MIFDSKGSNIATLQNALHLCKSPGRRAMLRTDDSGQDLILTLGLRSWVRFEKKMTEIKD